MQLKYSIVFDDNRNVINSFNFQETRAIDTSKLSKLSENILPLIDSSIGSITIDKGEEVLYFKGEVATIVLIGSDLNQELVNKLSNTMKKIETNFNEKTVSKSIFTNFHTEVIKPHFIPFLRNKENVGVSFEPEIWNIITKIDNNRTLGEIAEITKNTWMDMQYISSQLYNADNISFRVEVVFSSIYKLTTKGVNVLKNNKELSYDLRNEWKKIGRPILQMIDGETTIYEIYQKLIKSKISEEQLRSNIKLMLYEEYLKPVPIRYHLAIFLQKIYLISYKRIKEKIGAKTNRIIDEVLEDFDDIKILLPNFHSQSYKLELLYHLISELEFDEIFDFNMKYIRPLDIIYHQVSAITGKNLVETIKSDLKNIMRDYNEILISKYRLDQILL